MQTWTPVAFVLLHHRNKGALVLFHPGIGLGFNREQQKQFAGPDIIGSELKSAFRDFRRADEHRFEDAMHVGIAPVQLKWRQVQ